MCAFQLSVFFLWQWNALYLLYVTEIIWTVLIGQCSLDSAHSMVWNSLAIGVGNNESVHEIMSF